MSENKEQIGKTYKEAVVEALGVLEEFTMIDPWNFLALAGGSYHYGHIDSYGWLGYAVEITWTCPE